MAYAYCDHRGCESTVGPPSIREMIEESMMCAAGHPNPLYHAKNELISFLEDLKDRVERLEAR